jgi:altronate dehydratase
MEEVLKGLQGKNMSKKKLFDFLLDINLEGILNKSANQIVEPSKKEIKKEKMRVLEINDVEITEEEKKDDEVKEVEEEKEEVKPVQEFKCGTCMKNFATKSSLTRHHIRFPVCKEWIKLSYTNTPELTNGVHLVIDDILDMAICNDGRRECKFCKTKFITKGNHHKHYNTAIACNKMAFQAFKKLINEY